MNDFDPVRATNRPELLSAICQMGALNWAFTTKDLYDPAALRDFPAVQASYHALPPDPEPGNRLRAHSRFSLSHETGELLLMDGSDYSQSAEYNDDSGGKVRHFAAVSQEVLASSTLHHLIQIYEIIARATQPQLFAERDVTIGVHQIRYAPCGLAPAYSNPIVPHRDDERIVVVLLSSVSQNMAGDQNYLGQDRRNLGHCFRLQRPLDALVLGPDQYHGVGVMHSIDGRPAHRDILLVTFM